MKKLTFAAFLFISLFTTSFAAITQIPGAANKEKIAYLFIETADAGVIQKNSDGETYTLTLKGIDPWVTYFSNVPHRITGFMPVKDFSDLMNSEVTKDYPKGLNAGLVTLHEDGKQTLRYMLSLVNPRYDLKKDQVVFTAYAIPGKQRHPLPDNKSFQYAFLFIDNICVSCAGEHW